MPRGEKFALPSLETKKVASGDEGRDEFLPKAGEDDTFVAKEAEKKVDSKTESAEDAKIISPLTEALKSEIVDAVGEVPKETEEFINEADKNLSSGKAEIAKAAQERKKNPKSKKWLKMLGTGTALVSMASGGLLALRELLKNNKDITPEEMMHLSRETKAITDTMSLQEMQEREGVEKLRIEMPDAASNFDEIMKTPVSKLDREEAQALLDVYSDLVRRERNRTPGTLDEYGPEDVAMYGKLDSKKSQIFDEFEVSEELAEDGVMQYIVTKKKEMRPPRPPAVEYDRSYKSKEDIEREKMAKARKARKEMRPPRPPAVEYDR